MYSLGLLYSQTHSIIFDLCNSVSIYAFYQFYFIFLFIYFFLTVCVVSLDK